MYPVLFSLGPLIISSFGFFMSLSLIFCIFTVWRLVRVYDLDEERTLDLILLTFFGGLIGARIFFVILNWQVFGDLARIILINRYPGLSFWGGLLGGFLTLWFFLKRTKLNFWQMLDFAAVGLTLGLVFGNVGCFLGGCAYGKVSDSNWAIPVVGLIGKRLPVSLAEGLVYLLIFIFLWRQVVRFHFFGKILAEFLILLGIVKFITEFYRGDNRMLFNLPVSLGHLISIGLIVLGWVIFYKRSKRKLVNDLTYIGRIFVSQKARKQFLYFIKKTCYNQLVSWKLSVKNLTDVSNFSFKNIRRKLNVKPTPKNFR